jgi:hypothetical protein
VDGLDPAVAGLLEAVASETLARLAPDLAGDGVAHATIGLEAGPATIALRRRQTGADGTPRA